MKGITRKASLATLILLAVFISGCSFYGSVRVEVRRHSVSGVVTLSDIGTALANTEVFFNGPMDRRVVTDRHGRYSVHLAEGWYNVTVRTLHGDYSDRVKVSGSQVTNLPVKTSWYDRELLYALSGMTRYEIADWGGLTSSPGQLVRWDRSTVKVYFDTRNAPWNAPSGWAEAYLADVQKWYSRLGGRIRFERTYSDLNADVVVQLVPAGYFGNGIAQHVWHAYNGVLEGARIWIDVAYAKDRDLWEHEWAHAMGVYHSFDQRSVMYPAVLDNQRLSLSSNEERHIQLMYDLPPGLTVSRSWGAMSVEGDEVSEYEVMESETGWTYSGHIRTADGRTIELSEYEAQDLMFSW